MSRTTQRRGADQHDPSKPVGKSRSQGEGFVRAEYEWFASLLTAGLGALEQIILLEVILQCQGWSKKPAAVLSPSEIGERIGQNRSNVYRAIRSLVSKGLLVRLDNGTYAPQFDYTRWHLDEQPSQREARLRYVASAPGRAKKDGPPAATIPEVSPRDPQMQLPFREPPVDDPAGRQPAPDLTAPDHKRSQIRQQSVVNFDNGRSQIRQQSVVNFDNGRSQIRQQSVVNFDHKAAVPPTPPIGERGRELRKKREGEVFFEKGPEGQSGPDSKKKDLALWERLTPAERAARFVALKSAPKLHHQDEDDGTDRTE